jgi:serine phosphatase RsbU (regulator of sigma subunit)
VSPATVANHLLIDHGITQMAGVPLRTADDLVGVLDVGARERAPFTAADLEHLEFVGERIVTALAAHRQNEESRAAQVMQRSLLPTRLPLVAGLEFAARFVPASGLGIGGDWYDAFTLPGGRLVVVVGDVVGHGLRAAIVMGRLRSVVRAYAFDCDDPAEVIRRVTQKFAHFEPSEMATMLVAQLSPPMDEVVIATAGHPPPVLARPDQESIFVELDPAPPVGVRTSHAPANTTISLPPDSTLMCFTDGLFERRDVPFDESFEQLRHSLRTGPIERAISDVMNTMVGTELVEDDTALLALRRLPDR